MRYILLTLLLCCLIGCEKLFKPSVTYFDGTLECGWCHREIYRGKFRVEPNGFKWPVDDYHTCPSWDINCVNPEHDPKNERKYICGYQDGRKDAIDYYHKKTFDPKTHHPRYIEGYDKGYDEVMEVRKGK